MASAVEQTWNDEIILLCDTREMGTSQVELANRSICEGIKKRLNQSRGKWIEELDTVLWAYRTSPNTAIGEAPFTLVYGSNAVIPVEARLESYRITTYDTEQNSELRRTELDLVEAQREEAQVRAAKYKSIIKAGYDKRVRARKLAKGDLVLKRSNALKPVGKFEPNWEGPFIITESVPTKQEEKQRGEAAKESSKWSSEGMIQKEESEKSSKQDSEKFPNEESEQSQKEESERYPEK
ncbi:uncharacterized protein LOC131023117 [Salvia miltiorrhiza]|uniref:uncharacterized protein LOC131023117 n=1 Tax=Salvia miltiorrhiza TaxID=226208 RepID=UPI0025ACAE46|nr:uncharacterized protein LOC131023117 [Salvia miltiorrhiza]